MGFDSIRGQAAAVGVLRAALAAGRLHHAYRFEGPSGVGKEKTAFALAQALVCPVEPGVGCERCSACERALRFSEEEPHVPEHPDVLLLERGLYPASVLGRTSPESAGIGIEQVRRVVLERVGFPPHEARHLVVIVRAAHELTTGAANALLKTLEEPKPGVHFILLTDRPRALPATLRSRSLPVRFSPLSESVVADLLGAQGLDPAAAALSTGSMEQAKRLSDPESLQQAREFVRAVRQATRASDLSAAIELGAGYASDREQAGQLLATLGQAFAITARRDLAVAPQQASLDATAYDHVQQARQAVDRFSPPALVLEALVARLRRLRTEA